MEEKLYREGTEEDAATKALREALSKVHVEALVVVQREETLNEEVKEICDGIMI